MCVTCAAMGNICLTRCRDHSNLHIWREGGEVRFAFLADCRSESNLQSPRVCFIRVGFVKFQAKLLHPEATHIKGLSNFSNILSRLSYICFYLLYVN